MDIGQLIWFFFVFSAIQPALKQRLLELLRERLHSRARFSVHTNGARALGRMDVFNLYDRACISFPSFRPATYEKMMGSRRVTTHAATQVAM